MTSLPPGTATPPSSAELADERAAGARRRTAARTQSRASQLVWLVALAVAVVAVLPRALGLADFVTIDEGYHWIGRVDAFSDALLDGDWDETILTGHPGVTTMWLGSIGRGLAGLLGVANPGWAGGGADYLALLRLPLAVVNGLAVALGYLLLRRLLAPATALLAALLWGLAPFLIAHGRLLHLDALLTSFMTLSVLALLAAYAEPERPHRSLLVASGLCGGLALLTKGPALLLPPLVGLLLALVVAAELLSRSGPRPAGPLLRAAAGAYALWLATAALTAALLWPAMWVAPVDAVGAVLREVRDNGAQPHHSGNYFLGSPIPDPGPLFYPAVVLWRTDALTCLGLLLGGVALAADARRRSAAEWLARPSRRALLALGVFALLFTLALTLQAKKFDRYLLPIWPMLAIFAAAGLARAAALLAGARPPMARLRSAALAAVAAAGLAQAAWLHPYALAAFNPLLGGAPVAERVMLVGWGEGLEQVGAWLSARPDLGRGPVLSWIPPSLAPFVPKAYRVLDLRPASARQPSSYAVLYVRSVQRGESREAEALARQAPPLYEVRIQGVTVATVHQIPGPFDTPVDAVFGEGLRLRGYSLAREGGALVVRPAWSVETSQPGGAVLFVHVLNADGARVAQVDAPIDQGMFATWQAGQQFDPTLPIALPPDLPPGEYRLALGVYRPETGARLPVAGGAPAEPAAGAGAILLGTTPLP